MDKIKAVLAVVVTMFTGITSFLGMLAIPIYLMALSNVGDYITGLIAAKRRGEQINSYKGLEGIAKKITLWILVVVGGMVDIFINYVVEQMGVEFHIPYIVSVFVALWIFANEVISILENAIDIGVNLPPFLMPLVKRIKKEIETVAGEDDGAEPKGSQ